MKKLKICVYAICKNEEKFVNRWFESMKEADEIYALDTGSTDNTVKLLENLGVNVKQEIIKPWRFDVARNKSMDLLPSDTDICVCTDLDEVFSPNWRSELEKVWLKNTNRCRYIYNWSLDKNNKPLISFYYEKIHSRYNFKWIFPVHEILSFDFTENVVYNEAIVLNHYPDATKSRSSYLKLLELSVKENPDNDRNTHYLGREYMYYGNYKKCISTLKKHLKLKNSVWKDERCASCRFIARSYAFLKDYNNAIKYYKASIKEAPHLRDGYIELALLYYNLANYKEIIEVIEEALKIEKHPLTYINEKFSFDETPFDLLSLAYYEEENYLKSLYYINKCLETSKDERFINNKIIIIERIKESIKNENL